MVINHPTVLKFSIFDFGPLMYGATLALARAFSKLELFFKSFELELFRIFKQDRA